MKAAFIGRRLTFLTTENAENTEESGSQETRKGIFGRQGGKMKKPQDRIPW
jgi:hypothetical protein